MSERIGYQDIKKRTSIAAERIGGGMFERFKAYDAKETRKRFVAGMGPQELVLPVDGRNEYLFRHKSGFNERKLKIVSIGAHPDDTALSEGLEYLLVKQGIKKGEDHVGLAVITATDGQWSGHPHLTPQELGVERINEDVNGTALLGADMYYNLGFSDGAVADNKEALTKRLSTLLEELDADIVILPDPEDVIHPDHVELALAAKEALQRNQRNPIVAYTDFQNGDREITEDSFHFSISPEEYQLIQDAYLIHRTQTQIMTPDVLAVLSRPIERAKQSGDRVPFVGIGRQDKSFSQKPLEDYLGDSLLKRSNERLLFSYR